MKRLRLDPMPPAVLALALALVSTAAPARAFIIVRDHLAATAIVVAKDADPQVKGAARILQDYILKSTGALLPMDFDESARPAIQVGLTPLVRRGVEAKKIKLAGLDADGFVLQQVDKRNFAIIGGSDWGTEFGVYDFLERYIGVRWLMPTELGEDIPEMATLDLPNWTVRSNPVFLMRQLSPIHIDDSGINVTYSSASEAFYAGPNSLNESTNVWGRFNRARGRIAFHHNMEMLFPVTKFGQTHPEFYPFIDGQRRVPRPDFPFWQPNFSAPGLVDAGVQQIKDYFQDHPADDSYSLGMNDGRGWDQSPASLARRSGKMNSIGVADISDDFYMWANAVAEKVEQTYPDKWFGTEAYSNLRDPPTRVAVNPRIVPFMTDQRLEWIDPVLRKAGHERTERWVKAATVLGWYDYIYGADYLVPREWPHLMQDYLLYGQKHNVKFVYAELYPNWGEGPKPWLYTKLLWDPTLNVDELLEEWYEHAAGAAAAPKLREFYGIWEHFWTVDLADRHTTESGFYSQDYLLRVPASYVEQADAAMTQACALADTPKRRARMDKLAEMWAFYKASVLGYQEEDKAMSANPQTEADAIAAVDRAEADIKLAHERRLMLKRFAHDPLYGGVPYTIERLTSIWGVYWGTAEFWAAQPWISRSPAVKERMQRLAQSGDDYVRRDASMLLAVEDGSAKPVIGTGYFVDSASPMATAVEAGTGLSGGSHGGWSRTAPYVPGTYCAVVECHLPEGVRAGKLHVALSVVAEDGHSLRESERITPKEDLPLVAGGRRVFAIPFDLPSGENFEVSSGVVIALPQTERRAGIKIGISPGKSDAQSRPVLDRVQIYRID